MGVWHAAARLAIARCRALARFTEEPGRITRTFLSAPMHGVHDLIRQWMERAGCAVTVDGAGNLRGYYKAIRPGAPRFIIGSHLDTVPDAGAFDGILGVVLGVALLEDLNHEKLPYAIEVIGFSEEEGVRFGLPFIGSRAIVSGLELEEIARIGGAIREFGLNLDRLPEARLGDDVAGYLEIHIEQGPVLEHLNLPIGVVEAIIGQSRLKLTFQSHANHAGTTPMYLRHDAVACAAEWIAAVETFTLDTPGLIATIGQVEVERGAVNVIAGTVRASLDVRHACDSTRHASVDRLLEAAQAIASRRGLQVAWEKLVDQPSAKMDERLTSRFSAHRMLSGAGHDAMIMARRFPSALLFVRSPGGISHHPDETVEVSDVEAALAAAGQFLRDYV